MLTSLPRAHTQGGKIIGRVVVVIVVVVVVVIISIKIAIIGNLKHTSHFWPSLALIQDINCIRLHV